MTRGVGYIRIVWSTHTGFFMPALNANTYCRQRERHEHTNTPNNHFTELDRHTGIAWPS